MSQVMPRSVLRPEMQTPAAQATNVRPTERWLSATAGTALLVLSPRFGWARGLVIGTAGAALLRRGWTGHCHVYQALDQHQHRRAVAVQAQQGVHFERALIVQQPPAAIYGFWRNLSNLPQVIDHLESVVEDGPRSSWTARGPFGSLEWEAELTEQRPGELLAWRSIPGSQVDTAGSLRLAELSHGRGTSVRLTLKYDPPGGALGDRLGRALGANVEAELTEGLRRMKQLLEAGEIPTTDGQPQGTCRSRSNGRSRP